MTEIAGLSASILVAVLPAAAVWLLGADLNRRWKGLVPEPAEDRPAPAPVEPDAAAMLDLIGAMLDAGLSMPRALTLLAEVGQSRTHRGLAVVGSALSLGAGWHAAWSIARRRYSGPALSQLQAGLGLAAGTGAPAASILHATAVQLRRRRHRESERRAAALGVRLVVPLGVCSLPAFICLGVVPVLLALVPGV